MKEKNLMQVVERVILVKPKKNGGKSINIRLNAEEELKLDQRLRETGLRAGTLIKKFINEGEVHVRYDGKKVIQCLANTHDKFNIYSHRVLDDVETLQKTLLEIEGKLEKSDGVVAMFVAEAEITTKRIMERYMDEKFFAERELSDHVNIYSGK